jgi:uncharacterized membrane protein YedE/YeeE
MNLDVFTPFTALTGGALIGIAVSLFLLLTGRVTGISGIVGGLLTPRPGDVLWRALFVAGLVTGGIAASFIMPEQVAFDVSRSQTAIVVAGLLVGFGTRLGNGCTSGHGVCGISRFSTRSIVSTLTFMATGMITAVVVGQFFGGTL